MLLDVLTTSMLSTIDPDAGDPPAHGSRDEGSGWFVQYMASPPTLSFKGQAGGPDLSSINRPVYSLDLQ